MESGLFTLLGTFTGALLTIYITRQTNRTERFSKAYESFRKSFSTAVSDLGRNGKSRVEVVVAEYPAHAAAFFNFSTHLSVNTSEKLHPKWEEYTNYYDRYYENRDALNLVDFLLQEEDKTERKKILNLIHEILDIAKHECPLV